MGIQRYHQVKKLWSVIFLASDEAINLEKNYFYQLKDWKRVSVALVAIKRINKEGFLAADVSNKVGMARGLNMELDVVELHKQVVTDLERSDPKAAPSIIGRKLFDLLANRAANLKELLMQTGTACMSFHNSNHTRCRLWIC